MESETEVGAGDMKYSELWLQLLRNTSTHGVRNTATARGVAKKIYWWMLVLSFLGFATYHIYYVTEYYLTYPTHVSLSLQQEELLPFPAVTICNMSPVRRSKWEQAAASAIPANKKRKKRQIIECDWTGPTCAYNCDGLANGDYQYCTRCTEYLRCNNGALTIRMCPGATTWQDNEKSCNNKKSETCFECWSNETTYEPEFSTLPLSTNTEDTTVAVLTTQLKSETPMETTADVTLSTVPPSTIQGSTQKSEPMSTFIQETTWMNFQTSSAAFHFTVPPITTTVQLEENCTCCCAGKPVIFYNNTTTSTIASPEPNSSLTENHMKNEVLLEDIAKLPSENKVNIGSSLNEMIMDCKYEGSYCLESYFSLLPNPVYGNCYIFNSGWDASLLKSTKTGPRHGLQMILNIDQDEYVAEAGDAAGIRVLIHRGDVMPFPEDHGITIQPGYHTYVSLTHTEIHKLGKPYGQCSDDDEGWDTYKEIYPVQYTLEGCQRTCIQDETIGRCGCASSSYPNGEDVGDMMEEAPICSITNATQESCRSSVQSGIMDGSISCNCKEPCITTWFETEMSRTMWPSEAAQTPLFDELSKRIPHIFNDPEDPKKYARNLIKLSISFKEFNQKILKEEPAYHGGNYASDLGGIVGLWFGFSVFTLFEYLAFMVDSIKYSIIFCRTGGCSGICKGIMDHFSGKKAIYITNNTDEASMNPNGKKKNGTKKRKKMVLPPLKTGMHPERSEKLRKKLNLFGVRQEVADSKGTDKVNKQLPEKLALLPFHPVYGRKKTHKDSEEATRKFNKSYKPEMTLFAVHPMYGRKKEQTQFQAQDPAQNCDNREKVSMENKKARLDALEFNKLKMTLFPVHPTYGRKKGQHLDKQEKTIEQVNATPAEKPGLRGVNSESNLFRLLFKSGSGSNGGEESDRTHSAQGRLNHDVMSRDFDSPSLASVESNTDLGSIDSGIDTKFSIFPSHPVYGRRKQPLQKSRHIEVFSLDDYQSGRRSFSPHFQQDSQKRPLSGNSVTSQQNDKYRQGSPASIEKPSSPAIQDLDVSIGTEFNDSRPTSILSSPRLNVIQGEVASDKEATLDDQKKDFTGSISRTEGKLRLFSWHPVYGRKSGSFD